MYKLQSCKYIYQHPTITHFCHLIIHSKYYYFLPQHRRKFDCNLPAGILLMAQHYCCGCCCCCYVGPESTSDEWFLYINFVEICCIDQCPLRSSAHLFGFPLRFCFHFRFRFCSKWKIPKLK